jgi:hypothetical protein
MKYIILLTALILISCQENQEIKEIKELREINDSMSVNLKMIDFTVWSHKQTCKAQTEYIHRDSVRAFYKKEIEKLIYGVLK